MEIKKNYASNLFDMEKDDATLNFLNKKTSTMTGLYIPKITDKSKGYTSVIRFLPNLLENGQLGNSAIEKHVHYANLPNNPDLQGYYDSKINFGEKCPLTTLYWQLKNSKNVADNEKAESIGRTTKYYSYVLIVEDQQHPELVGKIMVFPYGFKIKEKIENERNGNNQEEKPCIVFDLANGKDFKLNITQKGAFPNYDSSNFKIVSPVKIWDEKSQKLVPVPTTFNEEKEKNFISEKWMDKVVDFLMTRTMVLEDNAPKRWTADEERNVVKIVKLLTGQNQSQSDYYGKGRGQKDEPTDIHRMGGDDDDDNDYNDPDYNDGPED